jgi:bifunctional non-homologous end joining protein LigD
MSLQVYHAKRKFGATPEPRGRQARRKGSQFVIQKHAARRLHYDLRLELDGVMKSWAVTRGPSLVPGEKRLAVHVEDHPIDYNTFEGTIPQGQYGGGTVLIWDRGAWLPEGDPHKGLAKGHLTFALEGEKLHGLWHLVRMHGRPGDKKANWLLIKAHDEAARGARDPDILEEEPRSVVTGRSISDIAEGKGRKRVWQSNRTPEPKAAVMLRKGAAKLRPAKPRLAAKPRPTAKPRQKGARAARRPPTRKAAKPARKSKAEPKSGAPLPDFIAPSLATLRAQAPDDPGWVHEVKFDGYRIQARLDHGEVRLLTRKGLDWTAKFPNVAQAVAQLPATTALIDGEIVVENENGISSFSGLQAALKSGERKRFAYYVFDLLHLDGRDLTGQPLVERKRLLADVLARAKALGPIRLSEHFETEGSRVHRRACEMALEGIVSKRKDAPYRSGRSETFIKSKCANAQEFVVGGYMPSTALPRAVGSLALGYYDHGRLVYAGRMGTGYTRTTAQDLWKRLHPLEIAKTPFDQIPPTERRRDIRWAQPKLVVESQFRGWTADGLLRQAAFKGLREDKPAREVVREVAVMSDRAKTSRRSAEESKGSRAAAHAAKAAVKRTKPVRPKVAAKAATKSPRPKAAAKPAPRDAKPWDDSDVHLTHPDRVYWVDAGVTKQDLADFYRAVWDWMAPHVVGRPLSLVRCPEGTKGQCFFQKHASAGLAEHNLRTVTDPKGRQIIAIDDVEGLLSLVQAGVLEVHVRGSKIDRLDRCDRIVFDLDPGEGTGWSDVLAAANDVRERLAAIDLESFVKLSGGKGVHVVLPIDAADWDTTKTFVQAFAQAMAADDPDRYVATMTKSLRKGRIFVDYLRNSLEQTSIAAYSTRARAGAPVSVPVSWRELGRTSAGSQYTVLNLMKRLRGLKQDPWHDIGRVKQKLPDAQSLSARG